MALGFAPGFQLRPSENAGAGFWDARHSTCTVYGGCYRLGIHALTLEVLKGLKADPLQYKPWRRKSMGSHFAGSSSDGLVYTEQGRHGDASLRHPCLVGV